MGCFRKHLKSQRGFTLLELLIALSLLGGIVGVIYSIQSFTMKTFAQGAQYAAMQLEARFISAYLSGEMRFAQELRILGDVPDDLADGIAVFVDRDGRVVRKSASQTTVLSSGAGFEGGSSLHFAIREDRGRRVVDVTMTFAGKLGTYEVTTAILALNVSEVQGSAGPVLWYRS